jgi:hypothetical protein
MSDIDPNNVYSDVEITLRLPRVITALDYHEFGEIQRMIEEKLGVTGVYVTEVGFMAPEYVGLIHVNTESHNQLVMELERYYQEQE